jgi:hypothetical protein
VRAFDSVFEGVVPSWIYTALRISLAGLLLIRSSDGLRGFLPLSHHDWVHGFDFDWSIASAPYLVSPLLPGLVLGARATWVAVRLRTALGFALLIGLWPAWSALSLALLSYALMFADRYRYFHHLHVLYLAIAWLALTPPAPARGARVRLRVAWPLQILRATVLGIYLSAGSAKLQSAWWGGDSLASLAHIHALSGPIWTVLQHACRLGTLAKAACLTELGLPVLLVMRRTRRLGVLLGVGFHALISGLMSVSTFSITMAVLLFSFWPERRAVTLPPDASCQASPPK